MSLDISSLNTSSLFQNSLKEDQKTFNQSENTLLNDFIKENALINDKQTGNSDNINNIIELSDYKKSLLNFVIEQNNKIIELIKQ